jgi:uncharacterized membrane protein (UPF0136 family)
MTSLSLALAWTDTVLWVYIVLLVLGGLAGYLKAGSKPSLIASVAFAALLALCALNLIRLDYAADLLLAGLLVVFGLRLAKTKKFMPAGLMLGLTLTALILRHLPS